MRRIAAPMVGGLLTSAFLTLELIPVIVTYVRQEELLWERLRALAPARQRSLARWAAVAGASLAFEFLLFASRAYITLPGRTFTALLIAGAAIFLGAIAIYLAQRRPGYAQVWPRVEQPRD